MPGLPKQLQLQAMFAHERPCGGLFELNFHEHVHISCVQHTLFGNITNFYTFLDKFASAQSFIAVLVIWIT